MRLLDRHEMSLVVRMWPSSSACNFAAKRPEASRTALLKNTTLTFPHGLTFPGSPSHALPATHVSPMCAPDLLPSLHAAPAAVCWGSGVSYRRRAAGLHTLLRRKPVVSVPVLVHTEHKHAHAQPLMRNTHAQRPPAVARMCEHAHPARTHETGCAGPVHGQPGSLPGRPGVRLRQGGWQLDQFRWL